MKGLAVLAAMLTIVLVVSSPALAQEDLVATGVLEKPEATTYMYGTHAITDEASSMHYALISENVDLDAYVGQRVTVYGVPVPGYENGQIEGGPPLLEVTWVEPA
jgi:tyrosine-protein phosphatase YwqE